MVKSSVAITRSREARTRLTPSDGVARRQASVIFGRDLTSASGSITGRGRLVIFLCPIGRGTSWRSENSRVCAPLWPRAVVSVRV